MEQSTNNSRIINAAPEAVYKAFTNPSALEAWQAPGDMKAKVYDFDFRVGGGYSMSLFYSESDSEARGKTQGNEDHFTAKFVEIIPAKKIVQMIKFYSSDPAFLEEMKMVVTFDIEKKGTKVTFLFENIPTSISPEDNERGTKSSLEKLALFVE